MTRDPNDPRGGHSVRQYTCPWCGVASVLTQQAFNCPACGADIDVRAVVDHAGWYEMPAIHDMARLQIGQSHCQIEGTYVPVADFNLVAPDHVYFNHHVLLWKDPSVALRNMSLSGWWKRLFAGLPLVMAEAH